MSNAKVVTIGKQALDLKFDQREMSMNTKRPQILMYVLAAAFFWALPVYGQVNTATITGSVTDPAHAPVNGAKIQAQNEGTGVVRIAITNSSGHYALTFLAPGTYSVSVQVTGFQSYERKGVVVQAAQVAGVDVELTVGTITQSVTVAGQTPLLNQDSSDQLHTVTNVEVRELPQAKLDWTNLLNFIPGVQKVTTRGAYAYIMNGLAPHSLNLTVDGTNASSNAEVPSLGFYQQPNVINVLNIDAISEVSVVKGIAPASVGGTISGNVNLISKSGTNQFHGDLYEINSVSAYNARNQFLSTRPRSTFNQYGGAIGGPILRDKFFFFGSYEGVRSTQFAHISGDVPTPYFYSISPALYADAWSAMPNVPQPSNDPTALSVHYDTAGSQIQNDNNTVDRFDYYINPTNEVTFRYTRSAPDNVIPRIESGKDRTYEATDDQYNVNFVHTTGNFVSSTRFGRNNLYLARADQGFYSNLEGVYIDPLSAGSGELFQLNGSSSTWMEDVSISHGDHFFQLGGIVQRRNGARIDLNTANLSYSTWDDYLNNIPSDVTITFDLPSSQLHYYQFGGYLQDNYKVTRALTLNLGVRYDYFTVPKEAESRLFTRGIDPARPQLGEGFGPYRSPNNLYNADYNNIQPRVGFAWTVGSTHQTVIRGGFGVFVSEHPLFAAAVDDMQAGPSVPFRISLGRGINVAGGLGYPIPRERFIPILNDLQSSGVVSTDLPSNTTIPSNWPNPYSMQWTMGVERDLGFGTVLSVGYVGSRGLKMPVQAPINYGDRITGIPADPTFPQFNLYALADRTTYHALQVKLDKRFSSGLSFGAYYTHAHGTAYGGGDTILSGSAGPTDWPNMRLEFGPSDYNIRNSFSATTIYELPFARWAGLQGRAANAVLGGWQVSGIFSANDGTPVNVSRGGSTITSRPDLVQGVPTIMDNYQSTLLYLNKAAFSIPPIVTASGAQQYPGNVPRNAFYGPGMWNLDASLAKAFNITEKVRLQLRGDSFNSFNHTNLSCVSNNVTSGSFGQLTCSLSARTMQIGARLEF